MELPYNLCVGENSDCIYWIAWGTKLDMNDVLHNMVNIFKALNSNRTRNMIVFVVNFIPHKDGGHYEYGCGYSRRTNVAYSNKPINVANDIFNFEHAVDYFRFMEYQEYKKLEYYNNVIQLTYESVVGYHFLISVKLDDVVRMLKSKENFNLKVY